MKHNFFTPGNYFYNGVGHVTVQYETVLAIGLNGVKEKVRKEMENCHFGDADYSTKMCFLESILISCDAVITYANRYAKMAEEMAEKETDAARRQELLTIARVCKNVPEFLLKASRKHASPSGSSSRYYRLNPVDILFHRDVLTSICIHII